MRGLKGKYYWIRTSVGIEIGHKRESGNWSLIGIGSGENMNSEVLEVIGEVTANEPTTSNETALNIDLVRQRSLLDTYNNERYANDKAAKEIKAFCECVMHPESDLHKDADEWIRERLK